MPYPGYSSKQEGDKKKMKPYSLEFIVMDNYNQTRWKVYMSTFACRDFVLNHQKSKRSVKAKYYLLLSLPTSKVYKEGSTESDSVSSGSICSEL